MRLKGDENLHLLTWKQPRALGRDAVASALISAAEAARGTTGTARRAFGTPLRRFDDSCTSA